MNAIGERLAQIHADRVALAGAHPRIVFIEPCTADEAERIAADPWFFGDFLAVIRDSAVTDAAATQSPLWMGFG